MRRAKTAVEFPARVIEDHPEAVAERLWRACFYEQDGIGWSPNLHRFPDDFGFQLSADEWGSLRSQIVTLKTGRGRHRKYPPWVFTEHGVLMLASVLQSDRAARVNIHIVRAFVRLRRLMATPGELAQQLMELAETVQDHEGKIEAITQVLRELLKPVDAKPKEMGFHTLK